MASAPKAFHVKRAVLIPTYNEAENIARIVAAVRAADPAIDIIVIDDGSPDGTGQIAESLPGVRVIHRAGKQGLGAAYIHGFAVALAEGYEALAQMDADFSHPPAVLPVMFERLSESDVCIGSRYVHGGGTENWGYHRKLLSGSANRIARWFLGLRGNDVTSGFRAYRREALEAIDLPTVQSQGYAFQVELQFRCERRGFRVTEVPIVFLDRAAGTSKMSLKEIRGGVANLLRLRFK